MLRRIKEALARPDVGGSRVATTQPDEVQAHVLGPTVLQVVRTYLPPSENWIYEQVRHIERYRSVFAAKDTANLDLFPFDPVYSLSKSALRVRLLDREIRKRIGYSPFFTSVAAKEDVSVIHAHGGGIATFVATTATKLGIPLVVSFYGVDMWKHPHGIGGLKRKYAELFDIGTLFLAEGPAASHRLAQIGCQTDRITVHRLGVEVASIPFVHRSLANGRELKVLMASRFAEKKGIPYGVEGFCRVAHDNPSMHLTIVGDSGSSRDARVRNQIERIADRHQVRQQVSVLGFVDRGTLGKLAKEHHILLHPSVTASNGDSEGGHPVVMTMLAASGMPILATRHCDIPEVVEHNRTGWLVAERSADEVETTLREIVRDPSVLKEFGSSARRLAETKYDIRSMRLDAVYDRVLAR